MFGVNLGSWLVLEQYMVPSIYAMVSGGPYGERQLLQVRCSDPDVCRKQQIEQSLATMAVAFYGLSIGLSLMYPANTRSAKTSQLLSVVLANIDDGSFDHDRRQNVHRPRRRSSRRSRT
jgi:hypothetical protein